MTNKAIKFKWDVQVSILCYSEMPVPAKLLNDRKALIKYIEDNIQYETNHDEMIKILDWDYKTASILDDTIQELP